MADKQIIKEQERARKHDCDGKCYWSTGMCPRVEYCEETRAKEFLATLLALITILVAPVCVLAIILFLLF